MTKIAMFQTPPLHVKSHAEQQGPASDVLTLVLLAHDNHRQASSIHLDVVLQHMSHCIQLCLPTPCSSLLYVSAILLKAGFQVILVKVLHQVLQSCCVAFDKDSRCQDKTLGTAQMLCLKVR